MKIATWNLWNSPVRWPERLDAAAETLLALDADLVALQEVPARIGPDDPRDAARYLAERCGYRHVETRLYPGEPGEGLALLSRYPLERVEAGWETGVPALANCGLRARIVAGETRLAIANVHLDYASIANREAQIAAVIAWIEASPDPDTYELLCGDFNSTPESSIYRYLMGQQTLAGQGTVAWHDLARFHAEKAGGTAAPTLDFWNNPRWHDASTLELPARVDWILLRDVFGSALPYPAVVDAGVFGNVPAANTQVVPSDHNGVYAELAFG